MPFSEDTTFDAVKRGGDEKEKTALEKFAELIGASENIDEISEGSESDDFWDLLGGEAEYFKLPKKGVSIILKYICLDNVKIKGKTTSTTLLRMLKRHGKFQG